jgi:hypothetical protein
MAVLDRPEDLLAAAAEQDARRARDAVARLTAPRLLEAVLTQALLAVEPGRVRPAGIDAVAELTRAAVEMTGVERGPTPAGADLPLVTGWELMTVGGADELVGATTSVPVRPWFLALIAFSDHPADRPVAAGAWRRVTAAAADGRLVSARVRLGRDGDDAVLDARVSAEPGDLGTDAALAWGLSRALVGAARTA